MPHKYVYNYDLLIKILIKMLIKDLSEWNSSWIMLMILQNKIY
jgi:hypothetical protein